MMIHDHLAIHLRSFTHQVELGQDGRQTVFPSMVVTLWWPLCYRVYTNDIFVEIITTFDPEHPLDSPVTMSANSSFSRHVTAVGRDGQHQSFANTQIAFNFQWADSHRLFLLSSTSQTGIYLHIAAPCLNIYTHCRGVHIGGSTGNTE